LQFALFDSASSGTQIGSTQTLNSVLVSAGVFGVTLDFGANSFSGANRFLEISARVSGVGTFTLLSPRQQVTATPYAIRSVNASSADTATTATTATNATQLGGIAASQYVQTGDSRLTDTRPPSAGSANYIQNTNSAQSGNFNISGNGTAAGTLTGSIVNAAAQFSISGSRVLSNAGDSNLFAGVGAGQSNTGARNSFFGSGAGQANTAGSLNSFFGEGAGQLNNTGFQNTFFGQGTGRNNTSGAFNSFFGQAAGLATVGGAENSMFGANAGTRSTGQFNSFFGAEAGSGITTGNQNTFIGARAGAGSAADGGINNTLLGFGSSVTSGVSNSTAIGYQAEVTQSNSIVLGANGRDEPANVGIGTTAPIFRLHVIDPGAAGLRVQTNTGGGAVASFGGFGDFQIDSNGLAGGRFIVQQAGRVGISTNAPTATLSVNGTADKPGGGSWGVFSDERLKNIKGRFTPGLNAVLRLQPLRYEYKRDNALNLKSEGEHIGFSAQAVQKVIPEAVIKDDKGYLLVNNDPIMWTMLNAIKEQQAQIETQQKQIEGLKKLVCRSRPRTSACR